jgi:hypothetical protein
MSPQGALGDTATPTPQPSVLFRAKAPSDVPRARVSLIGTAGQQRTAVGGVWRESQCFRCPNPVSPW